MARVQSLRQYVFIAALAVLGLVGAQAVLATDRSLDPQQAPPPPPVQADSPPTTGRAHVTASDLNPRDAAMLTAAKAAAGEIAQALEAAIDSGIKSEDDIFSTLYFPILPLTNPPTFSTAYDDYTDAVIRPIEDRYQAMNKAIVFVALVDRNGYLPSHNSSFSQPRTGDRALDLKINRTKRIFNDVTGFRAAKNQHEFLLQTYRRDTGEGMKDLSVPVGVKGRHWGALRIGYADE